MGRKPKLLSLKHHSVPRKRIPRPKESSYITITPAKHTALQGLFQIKNVSIKECNNWLRRFTFYNFCILTLREALTRGLHDP